MRQIRKLHLLIISLLLLCALVMAPAETQLVQAQGNVVYNLYATDGYINMADGTQQYIYGFVGGRQGDDLTYQLAGKKTPPGTIATLIGGAPAPTAGPITPGELPLLGNAQFPAPVIYAGTNQIVEIRLKNLGVSNKVAPNDPHSIHLHGLDVNAANDGVPETSLGAVPANAAVPGAGNIVVYMFTTDKPGTSMYHCHQEANIHVQMGMYGALVVYNAGDAGVTGGPGAGPGVLYDWSYDKDYILLLSEFDSGQHLAEQFAGARGAYNSVNYKPQYWFINGLSFPNTIHAGVGFNWANWIASHPGYDPFIIGQTDATNSTGGVGQKILLRVINMGFQTQPMHMHGFHGKIIGSDQRAWPWANTAGVTPTGQGMEKNTLTIGSGETYEWLLDFGVWAGKTEGYYPTGVGGGLEGEYLGGTQSKMNAAGAPVSNTDPNGNPIPDMFAPPFTYIGGPRVGPWETKDLFDPVAVTGSEAAHLASFTAPPSGQIPGQLFPFHNHDDYKATNNGVYPGGMFTMIMPVP